MNRNNGICLETASTAFMLSDIHSICDQTMEDSCCALVEGVDARSFGGWGGQRGKLPCAAVLYYTYCTIRAEPCPFGQSQIGPRDGGLGAAWRAPALPRRQAAGKLVVVRPAFMPNAPSLINPCAWLAPTRTLRQPSLWACGSLPGKSPPLV